MSLNWKSTVSLLDMPKPALLPLPVARPCLPVAANFKDFCFVWTPSAGASSAQPAKQKVKAQPDLAALRAQAIAMQQRLARAELARITRAREGPQPMTVVATEVAEAAKAAQQQFERQALEREEKLQQARLQAASILCSAFGAADGAAPQQQQQPASDAETASTASASTSDNEAEPEPKEAFVSPSLVAVAIAEASKPQTPRPTPYVKPPPKNSKKGPGPRWHVPGELTVTGSAAPADTKKPFDWVAPVNKKPANSKRKAPAAAWGAWDASMYFNPHDAALAGVVAPIV